MWLKIWYNNTQEFKNMNRRRNMLWPGHVCAGVCVPLCHAIYPRKNNLVRSHLLAIHILSHWIVWFHLYSYYFIFSSEDLLLLKQTIIWKSWTNRAKYVQYCAQNVRIIEIVKQGEKTRTMAITKKHWIFANKISKKRKEFAIQSFWLWAKKLLWMKNLQIEELHTPGNRN